MFEVEVLFVTCSGAVHVNFECDFVRSGTYVEIKNIELSVQRTIME